MQVFDQLGNQHPASDLLMPANATAFSSGTAGPSAFPSYNNGTPSGYFQIYYAPKSGFDPLDDGQIAIDRLLIIDRLLKDLSAFINSPLTSAAGTPKVNILLDTIHSNTGPPAPAGTVAIGYSFAYVPIQTSRAAALRGVLDNSVWTTIKTGQDAYASADYPLVTSSFPQAQAGDKPMIHAVLRFNFPAFVFHNDLSTQPAAGEFDLYSVALHEFTHALGFGSFINAAGNSTLGSTWSFYSRYDLRLKTQPSSAFPTGQFLIVTDPTCTGYDARFNSAIPNVRNSNGNRYVLEPGTATLPATSYTCVADHTNCSDAIKYVGTVTQAVYTPNCFSSGSSLSHFEDECLSPANNNGYFVMSNQYVPGTSKRHLTPQERAVLCDIGYSVNTAFGDPAGPNYFNYFGSGCAGLGVAGVNDGARDAFYQYITNLGQPITINDALENDIGANKIGCLESVIGNGTISHVTATRFTYTPTSIPGGDEVHVLRYLPTNTNTGEQGNITYIFIKVLTARCDCAKTTAPIVSNGDFESSGPAGQCGILAHTIIPTLPYLNCWTDYNSFVDNTLIFGPILKTGSGAACGAIAPRPGSNSYIQLDAVSNQGQQVVLLQNALSRPLLPGGQYKLEFYARCPDGVCPLPATYTNQLIILGEEALAIPEYLNFGFNGLPPPSKCFPMGTGTNSTPGVVELNPVNPLSNPTLSPNWQLYTYTFTISPGLVPRQFPYILIGAYGGKYDLDDVSITAVSTPANSFSTASALLAHYGATTTGTITTDNIINIDPVFTVDVPLTLKKCPHVVCAQNAEITVQSGTTLSLTDGTVVRADCSAYWKGIQTASSTSSVFIDRSEIHDMSDGVRINGNAPFSCTNSFFIDNLLGIVFSGTPASYTDVVEGNEFYRDIRSAQIGIKISECHHVQVGNLATGKGNSFHDLKTGIYIEHLNSASYGGYYITPVFELYNNDFHDIYGGRLVASPPYVNTSARSDQEGSAIYAYNNGPGKNRVVNLSSGNVIVDYTTGSTGKFRSCDKGIFLEGNYSAQVKRADMQGGWGITANLTDGQHYTIQHNTIRDAVVGMSFHGINSGSLVSGNTVTNSYLATPPPITVLGTFVATKGIDLSSYAYVYQSTIPFTIRDNTLLSYSGAGSGINLLTPAGFVSVLHNTIDLYAYLPGTSRFSGLYGISANYAGGDMISNNTINQGAIGVSTGAGVVGIQLSSSLGMIVSCNHLSNMQFGLQAEGNCQTGYDRVSLDTFINHMDGMLFRHIGVEGTLGDIGKLSVYDGKNQFSNTPPGGFNLFRITASCPTSPLMPFLNNIYTALAVTSSSNLGCKKYLRVGNSAPQPSCGTGGDPASLTAPNGGITDPDYERQVASGQMMYSEYPAGSKWLEQSRLFHQLRLNPDAWASDSVLDAFYQATLGTAMDDIDKVNGLIIAADTAQDSITFSAAWQSAWTANAGMQLPNQQATNEQGINTIYLKYKLGGKDTLTAADSSTIAAIALQCPLVGGNAVYKARHMYLQYQPLLHFNNFGRCNYPDPNDTSAGIFDAEEAFLAGNNGTGSGISARMGRPDTQPSSSAAFQLYPNPVTGVLHISFTEAGTLDICDITNRRLKTIQLSGSAGGKMSVNMQDIPAGVCICRYFVEGKLTEVRKITVLHE